MTNMEKKIQLIQKLIIPFGEGLKKVTIITTCSIDGIGRRYESKGSIIPIDADEVKVRQALFIEIVYMRHFLEALGFPEVHVSQRINEFIDKEINE